MQIAYLIKYFFYLAYNWNIRIAAHIIRREITGEKKYAIHTTGADELKQLDKKGIDIEHATIYMPASYDVLETIFEKTNISSFKHLIDIGSGKGRPLCVAAHFGARKVTGIDFSKEFCEAARTNLQKTQQVFPNLQFRIYNNDAFYFEIPDDVDCIFMFNPFDEIIMSGVIENIEVSLENNPREITIIYINPLQKHLFLDQDYQQVFEQKKLTYLEVIVLTKSPGDGQG
ncbi:MAG: class I SAM-dependent methyltransferase [Gloeobacteraceae cyanobacterium ES-bin-316]|nr:class I SAM-dependent methyltransferase [Ferruginibacter sp.]